MMTWIPAAWSADAFYEQRLTLGKQAVAAQRAVDAVDQLRIAAFGLLDEPKLLSQALALLALAQSQLGRTADLDATLTRFVDVETRFAAYDANTLDADARTKFEPLLVSRVPKSTLAGIRSLSRLVNPQPAPPPARAEAQKPPTQSAAVAAANTPDDALANARMLLKANKPAEAAAVLTEAANRAPSRRDLRLLLLQAATMSANWPLATAQLPAVRPFTDNDAPYMFYAAVVLYETHNEAEARDLMQRAVPRISRSPYVDYYANKLGVKPK